MPKLKDLTGQRFGILTVLSIDESSRGGKSIKWIVKCDCGVVKSVYGLNLSRKNEDSATRSCGCRMNMPTKILFKDKRLYRIWNTMIQRCENPNSDAYSTYGARGIKVCEQWHDYRVFHKDVIEGYASDLTIDRINNDGNYEPGNTQWITRKQQNRKYIRNVVDQNDVDFIRSSEKSIKELSEILSVSRRTIYSIKKNKTWV